MHRSLLQHKFNAAALHGDMDQSARTAALESFRNGEVTLLVASDVAARGLDIPAVSHIFNFDVPHHPDDYVHRIGRTGRAGLSGTAITIVAPIDGKAVARDRAADRPDHPLDGRAGAGRDARAQPRERRAGRAQPARRAQSRPQPRTPAASRARKSTAPHAAKPQPQPRPQPPREAAEESDGSHLPAFLLRPVSLKA